MHSKETTQVNQMDRLHSLMYQSQSMHFINMSYGEYSHWSNTGRVGEMMNEVINKYGVVWVASAGNNGPALCTVGTPPDIATNTVIGKVLILNITTTDGDKLVKGLIRYGYNTSSMNYSSHSNPKTNAF